MLNNVHTFVILAYKESPHLEDCIKSILGQTKKSNVIIATTTLNKHIKSLAKKYQLEIKSTAHTNLGGDFDFAVHSADTPLVTVAHQDDIYEETYLEEVFGIYQEHSDSSIIFTDYYEIRGEEKAYTNLNLKIKRFLLFPAECKKSLKTKFMKRQILRFGNSICCPSVTFVVKNCPEDIFKCNLKCNVDWHAWETLSREPGAFTFINKPLMGHRISDDSTTTETINQGVRTKEDYQIFKRFWPTPIAKLLTKFYQKSEKSNQLKTD